MKKVFFFFLVVLSANAQTFSDHYYQRKTLFESTPDTKDEIIFLGNSITEGGDWKALFPNNNVINRGISGDVTEGILNRLSEVTSSRPKKIFLLIGTNDLARGKNESYVVDHVASILNEIKKESEYTEIYLQSILPVNPGIGDKFSGHKKNQQLIVSVNKMLMELSKRLNVVFVDLHKKFRNSKGVLKPKYTDDGLHLNKKGYQKWKKILTPYVK
ncbi:GDSL-type esterase/lipase family protein [Arenibacter sp. S6351L]|uniref:GDSL-type esterase/lipase family protein n=1 Tax=Arenibacter sp. S6351L TaxID=2926407 RepID=UPI001FF41D1F|nr:GDSL-type esterase/lipase family protein [Arenibacter sp. S6351L]MCK0135451.1 GDSL-type esterase/lipase family protein [Arenibacter sp. S6351L]